MDTIRSISEFKMDMFCPKDGYATAPALILVGALMRFSCQGKVGRLHRFGAGVSDAYRYAADIQHCDGPEPWTDLLHGGETGVGQIQGD